MKKERLFIGLVFLCGAVFFSTPVYAMHIMEGFLPVEWAVFWTAAALPFVIYGAVTMKRKISGNPELRLLLGMAGAFAFVLSALKIPSVTGSSSHPTGVALGAVLFGPFVMSLIGCIVLLFQAVLLAHGGLTTLGANTFSMAVAGTLAAYGVYRLAKKIRLSNTIAVFLAALLGDLTTYLVTSLQLALAFPAESGGVMASLVKFFGIFALTQIPLAVSEGLLSVIVYNFLTLYSKQELLLLDLK